MTIPEDLDSSRHDLTALYAFIDSVVNGLAERRFSAAYRRASVRFFQFLIELAQTCRDHIADWRASNGDEFDHRRPELEKIRGHWRELHKLIKPSIDADTLQVPSAVVDGIARRFRELPECDKTEFALFHTAEFNYIQVHTSALRGLANAFRGFVPNAPAFPENLSLIGIPYSQGRTAFANCLVAHEMGHYRYQGTGLESDLRTEISKAFDNPPSSVGGNQKRILAELLSDPPKRDALQKQMALWAEETFCDLFAIKLIGPCYTYAYIEAYDLCALLSSAGTSLGDQIPQLLQFYHKYPSHLFRVQQQCLMLRETGWWTRIETNPSRSASLLKSVAVIPMEDHLKGNESHGTMIRILEGVLPSIRQAIAIAFEGVDDRYSEFSQLNDEVQTYLANGIVPSTLNLPNPSDRSRNIPVHPSPVVLLNSGMEFYLTRIDELMRSIPSEAEKLDQFSRRLHWIRRVEDWVAKAIEDESLDTEGINGDHVDSGDPRSTRP